MSTDKSVHTHSFDLRISIKVILEFVCVNAILVEILWSNSKFAIEQSNEIDFNNDRLTLRSDRQVKLTTSTVHASSNISIIIFFFRLIYFLTDFIWKSFHVINVDRNKCIQYIYRYFTDEMIKSLMIFLVSFFAICCAISN